MLPNWIRSVRRRLPAQDQNQPKRRRFSGLGLDLLENRLVPTVSAFFDPTVGALQVTIDEDASKGQNVNVVALKGWTRVVSDRIAVPIDTPLGMTGVRAKDIRSISINGSSLDNSVDLRGVGPRSFPFLDGRVEIHGGAGSDTLIGSQLNDRIWGDDGSDVLSGQNGNDWLNGGPGSDTVDGSNGDDHIEASDNEQDVANGGPGENTEVSDSSDTLSSFQPHGLLGEYFADGSFDTPGEIRIDPVINFNWGHASPYSGDPMPQRWTDNLNQSWYVHYTVRWTGRVVPKFSETYNFNLTVDDGGMLWVNDQLIINTWKDQNPTTYTGQIDLAAGEPVSIKLLYYNSWFGASVKLRWSSASQANEIIPENRLLPPERETPLAIARVPSLAGRVSTQTISLPGPVNYARRGGWGDRPNTILAPLVSGGYKLGWTDRSGTAHITTFDSNQHVVGTEITLPGLDLRGLVAHEDGFVGVMAARNSYQMVVLRLDPDGNRVFETILTGANPDPTLGTHLDRLWTYRGRFITTGSQYAVHFAHIEPGGHQGGYYATLDFTGRKLRVNGWTVSHSLDQRLLYHQGQYFSMSLGDVYPKGIHFENRTLGRGKVIYPAKDQIAQWSPNEANLGSMVSVGKNIGVILTSKHNGSKELFYLLLDTEGRILRTTRLSNTAAFDESIVRLVPFGKNLLVAWQISPNQTKVAVINADGKWLNNSVVINQPLPGNDEIVAFPNGDVGWLVAKHGESTMSLVRIRK
jgi:hypothetical protein